jgi:acetyltransferase-like isoleucine patch superfamily enzyme
MYTIFAHALALLPGMIGDYARTAYYFMTLEQFSLESRILFGSYVAHRETSIGPHVVVNPYCILGRVNIGARTLIAANTHILSGAGQHIRDEQGHLQPGTFRQIEIGSDCWIGVSVIVMADVGDGATVGAGSVVVKPVPAGATVVGNPARIISS